MPSIQEFPLTYRDCKVLRIVLWRMMDQTMKSKLFSPANATQTLGTSAALCEKAKLRHVPQGNLLPKDTKACIPEEDYLPSPSIDKAKQ